ncbi:hypothetical protein Pmar_PMAR028422, partial [Perkinsus marinus ATCC 50983]
FKNDMFRMKLVHNFDTMAFYYYTLRYLGGVALREVQKVLAIPTDACSLPVDRIWERLDALYLNSTAIRTVITTYSEQRQGPSEPIDDFLTRFEYTLIDYEATVGVDLTDDQKIGQLLSAVQPVLRDELTMRRDTTSMSYAIFRSAVQSIGRVLHKRQPQASDPSSISTTVTSTTIPVDPFGPTNFQATSSTTDRLHKRTGRSQGCFRCYRHGHRAADCKAPEPAQKGNRCLICGSTKHKSKACARSICLSTQPSTTVLRASALPDDSDPVEPIELDCSVAHAAHLHAPASQYTATATCLQLAPPEPRLDVSIGKTTAPTRPTISALLDTGATTGLISRSYVDKLLSKRIIGGDRLTTIEPVVITYGNGSQAQTSTELCLPITISPQGKLRLIHLLVVPGMKPSLVFGRSVLKQLQVTLRYSPVLPVDTSPSTSDDTHSTTASLDAPDADTSSPQALPPHITHFRASVALPSWVRLDPALQVQEVLDSTDWLVVACVSDGTSQYIWCDIDDIQVPNMPVLREHPKLTSAPAAVKAEAVRFVDDMLSVGKISLPPPGLHVRAITNYYPVVGKRIRPVFPSLQVNYGLNRLLRTIRFRQSPLAELKTALRGCVHAISMDVQDAFMQLRVGVELQRFLGLYHRDSTFVFTRVPYGLAISPHILEVAVRYVVRHLVMEGVLSNCQVTVLHYMDDVFLLSTRSLTPNEVSALTGRVVDLFARYSLPMSPKKTIVLFDTAKVNALGLEYVDNGTYVRFPLPRWQALFHITTDRLWTYRTVLSHLGMLTAESDVLPEHCLEQRNLLQGLLTSERHRMQRAWNDAVSPALCDLLCEWLTTYAVYTEPPLLYRFIDATLPITVYTDASQYALAYKVYQNGHLILQGQRILRRRTERALHANVLELYAVYFALSRLILHESLAKSRFAHLTLFTDNKTALSCLRTLRTKSTNPIGQQAFLQ